jgi:tetratricopeptide (TPR) repeat protein
MGIRTASTLLACWMLLHGGVASAQPPLQRAAALVQQGRLEEADQQAQLALSDPQTRALACSVLGAIRFQQQRLADSATFLREAIALEPRLLGAHLNLAEVLTLQGKPEDALPLFTRALELDRGAAGAVAKSWMHATDLATVPQAWSVKVGLLLIQQNAAAEAIDVLEHARRSGAGAPSYELAFNLGGAYLLRDDLARALDAYDAALSVRPDAEAMPALRQAAAIAERRGELERSLAYWMRAKKVAPEDPLVLLGFGRVCLKMDLLDDAEPALATAARLKPDDPTYQYTLAAAKVGKKQFEAAQAILEPLVARKPDDPQLQYAIGSVLYIQGKLDDAATHLKESVRLQPEQLASNYYLALVARDQGRDAEAIDLLARLVQRYPDHGPSCEALGELLMSAQRYPEAERYLRTAIDKNAKSVKANYQLGLLLARTGRKAEADKQLALAKSLRTEDEATSRLQLRLLDP